MPDGSAPPVDSPAPVPPGFSASRTLPWLGVLAFASGAPYALVNDTAPLLYKFDGVDLTQVGLLSALATAWVLKFLLAPLVDRYGARRTWIVAAQLSLAGALLWVSTLPAGRVPLEAWVALGAVALLSAVLDLAVDAYAVDATPTRWLGPANSVRVGVYRVALVVAGGTLVARSDALGWAGTWQVAAGTFLLLALVSLGLPPTAPHTRPTGRPLVEPLRRLWTRPHALGFLAFVLLFKVGDRAMAPSTKPFLASIGFDKSMLGDIVPPVVTVAAILGAALGGWLTRRWGPYRALWTLGALQAVSNLGYALAAATQNTTLAWGAAFVEPFCGGLGTTPFLVVLMLACERGHVATQFAFLTALMGVIGGSVAIGWGALAKAVGYGPWFALTFLLALPAFALLPRVRGWLAERPPGLEEQESG